MAAEDAKLDYEGIKPFEQSQGNDDPVQFSGSGETRDTGTRSDDEVRSRTGLGGGAPES